MYVNHIKSIVMAVLTILLGGFAVECGRDTDHKLDSIAQIIETNPDRALAKLKDIDSEDLTEAEGYYLALFDCKGTRQSFYTAYVRQPYFKGHRLLQIK